MWVQFPPGVPVYKYLMKHTIPLSESTLSSIRSVYAPLRKQYIDFYLNAQESAWAQSYNVIKDSSWPECNGYKDFDLLPDYIKIECADIHQFSPEILKQAITSDADRFFQIGNEYVLDQELLEVLNQNLDIIQNKKIIDIGCNFGHWSIFAHHNHCSNVLGVDIRKENIDIASLLQQQLEIPNTKMKFDLCDVHQHDRISQLCVDRDTVFLLGVMYHVHDHYDILKSLCQSNVKNIVIMNRESTEIIDSDMPLIWWKYEPTFELLAGFYENQTKALVGYPHPAWIDLTMNELGFSKKSYKRYHKFTSTQQEIEKFKQFTSIFLYERVV